MHYTCIKNKEEGTDNYRQNDSGKRKGEKEMDEDEIKNESERNHEIKQNRMSENGLAFLRPGRHNTREPFVLGEILLYTP